MLSKATQYKYQKKMYEEVKDNKYILKKDYGKIN